MNAGKTPSVVVLAGPNGAGKSTAGPALLRETIHVVDFVNADTIARGLSAYDPEGVAFEAGRTMLLRLKELARQHRDFAFETTMAGRAFAPWLARIRAQGYRVHILFLWLPSPEVAIARVASRRRMGGHDVPEEIVRRRYHAGIRNFVRLYRSLADVWRLYDNSSAQGPRLVACGTGAAHIRILDPTVWDRVLEGTP